MKELSPKIIRVLFDTILNPMNDGLEVESSFLKNGNLTWKGNYKNFENLRPLFSFCNPRYQANLEQGIIYFPQIEETISKHDSSLKHAVESCAELYEELKNSELLIKVYNEKLEETLIENPEIEEYIKNDFKNDFNYRYIAEYIINNKNDLDSAYTLSPIWNLGKDNFKNILNDESLNLFSQNTKSAISNFNITVTKSMKKLKELRNKLSINYGEPIVVPIYEPN